MLGGTINALGVVQSLGRRNVPVYVVRGGAREIAPHSRYARELRLRDAHTAEGLVDGLLSAAETAGTRPALFLTSDVYLRVVSRHRDRLSEAFLFHLPAQDAVETVADKSLFASFAERHDLPVPRTAIVRPLDDARALVEPLRFPVVLKPNVSGVWPDGTKIVRIADRASVPARCEALAGSCESLVVQESLESPDSEHFSFYSYRTPDRGEIASVTVQKLRVLPIHGGAGVFARAVHDPELARAARNALDLLGYLGASSVCFKTDGPSGRRLIYEINGRLPAGHGAFRLAGIDLPHLVYSDLLGVRRVPPPDGAADGKWVTLAGDVRAFAAYRRAGELSLPEWIASYRGVKVCAELTLDDPAGIAALPHMAAQSVRSTLGGLARRHRAGA